MYKSLTFIKRRPDLTIEEFRRYYEERHAPLGSALMTQAVHYRRRYIVPMAYPGEQGAPEADFDVVTEVWCESRQAYEEMMTNLADPKTLAIINEDEGRFMDRSRTKVFVVEEERETSIKI